MLRFFANMTQSQIGEEVGISQMNVSRLLTRTLAQLREGLISDAETSRARPFIIDGLSATLARCVERLGSMAVEAPWRAPRRLLSAWVPYWPRAGTVGAVADTWRWGACRFGTRGGPDRSH